MNMQIHAVHFDADEKLTELVKEKVEKLSTFHDKITSVDVYLRLDNVAHQIKDKVVEIKVGVPKHSYFVKHESKTFEESFNIALDAMINQLKRQKEKLAVNS